MQIRALVPIFALLCLGADIKSGAGNDPFAPAPEFLPVDEAFIFSSRLEEGQLIGRWDMPAGYYLYRHRFEIRANEGTTLGQLVSPVGKSVVDEYFGESEVYYGSVEISAPIVAQTSRVVRASFGYQGCADYGLCYPPEVREVAFDVASSNAIGSPPPQGATSLIELVLALGSALLGGIILNLMPCVFPVLSIKALSLVDAPAGGARRRHALGYVTGTVATFLALGIVLAVLRGAGEAIGWGFQLQSPGFVTALALLFFTLGLNLLGVLEVPAFGIAMGTAPRVQPAARHGKSRELLHAFATGVLAVVVATPCTVPFMGAALGFGLSRSAGVMLLIMAALGIGMALPYLAVTGVPAIARRLPRPGAWMRTFKQLMAFPMFVTVVWLAWVLARQAGTNAVTVVLAACVGLGFLAWFAANRAARLPWTWVTALVVAAMVVWTVPEQSRDTVRSEFDVNALEARVANGDSVFLNLTAAWCITCLANERTTLSTARVRDFFAARGIAHVKGDWTNADPAITALLKRFGHSGVPLYVYYPAGRVDDPVILPQLLTPGIVIDAITATDAGATGTGA